MPDNPNLIQPMEALDALRTGRWSASPRRSLACLMIHAEGLETGDRQRFEAALQRNTAPDDLVARLREDVYMVILGDRRLLAGMLWADACHHRAAQPADANASPVVVRTGVVAMEARHLSVDALELAEAALDMARELEVATASWDMVEIDAILHATTGGSAIDRFERFVGDAAYLLGPAQLRDLRLHAADVGRTAERIATRLGLHPSEIERCRIAGTMHDLGKTAIPEELLARPAGLSHPEWMLVARHAEIGAMMATRLGADESVVEAIRHHHAPVDAAIQPGMNARIVAVAETVAAITADTPYSAARTADDALTELARGSGSTYDPRVVRAAHELGAAALAATAA